MLAALIDNWNASLNSGIASLGSVGEDLIRIVLAVILGGLIGLERELRGRQAGFRTHILVCVGSALVMLVSIQFAIHRWAPQIPGAVNINLDPARIAYGVMTGIGFLGAGAIVHANGGLVRGLTTAAAMWCVAAIGLAAGFGMYVQSVAVTAVVLAVLWVLDYIEEILPRVHNRVITIRRPYVQGCIQDVVSFVKSTGVKVTGYDYRRTDDLQFADVDVGIAYKQRHFYAALENKIESDSLHVLLAAREV